MIPELIGGAILSIVVQLVKKYVGTRPMQTMIALVVLALLGAWGYSVLQSLGYWESAVAMLVTASGLYGLLTGSMKALK
jgi:hypothetical protein|tara:strand:- start:905 stop:1141 length:237 start_codon:yes stop_codon:yes gene_type:complete